MRNILIVNDDGIHAPGIARLAAAAVKYGKVTVVAPAKQCSAMSQCISIRGTMNIRKVDFPVPEAEAYSVTGTPADCTAVSLEYLLKDKPDYVFSGINDGANVGFDVGYSGTVGAAMEAMFRQIPAAAFSVRRDDEDVYGIVNAYLDEMIEMVLANPPKEGHIWNINFPAGPADTCKGVKYDRPVAPAPLFLPIPHATELEDGSIELYFSAALADSMPEGTDLETVRSGYVSVGQIRGYAY